VHPKLAAELAALIVADPGGERLSERLAREPGLPRDAIVSLAERARSSAASLEETALALGILAAVGALEDGVRAR
jgi:hypothetical protein